MICEAQTKSVRSGSFAGEGSLEQRPEGRGGLTIHGEESQVKEQL